LIRIEALRERWKDNKIEELHAKKKRDLSERLKQRFPDFEKEWSKFINDFGTDMVNLIKEKLSSEYSNEPIFNDINSSRHSTHNCSSIHKPAPSHLQDSHRCRLKQNPAGAWNAPDGATFVPALFRLLPPVPQFLALF
jgi:hypothetical protein